jgi:hypothetical protein
VRTERLYEPQLLLRLDPAEDVRASEPLAQFFVVQARQLCPGHDLPVRGEACLPGDGGGRRRVVARDHHHTDAGGPALRDRFRHIGADRIFQRYEPEEFEVEVVLHFRQFTGSKRGPGDAQHAQTIASHCRDLRSDRCLARRADVAQVDDGFGRALGGYQPRLLIRRLPHA